MKTLCSSPLAFVLVNTNPSGKEFFRPVTPIETSRNTKVQRQGANREEGESKEGHDGNHGTVHPFTSSWELTSCLEPSDSWAASFGAMGCLANPDTLLVPSSQHATLVTSLSRDAKAGSIYGAYWEEESELEDGRGRDGVTVAALSLRWEGQTQSASMTREGLCERQLGGRL